MRTRDEIDEKLILDMRTGGSLQADQAHISLCILEVLLDIRDLLTPQDK